MSFEQKPDNLPVEEAIYARLQKETLFPNPEGLPDPKPGSEWGMLEDVGGDELMAAYLQEYEDNENLRIANGEKGLRGKDSSDAEDHYYSTRERLKSAIAARRHELQDKINTEEP